MFGYVALFTAKGAAMLLAVIVAVLAFRTGLALSSSGGPERIPMLIFGGVGLLAAVGGLRVIRARGIQGSRRIARHLWRVESVAGFQSAAT